MLEPILELLGLEDKPKKRTFRWKVVEGRRIVSRHYKKVSAEKAKKRGQKVYPINAVVKYKKRRTKPLNRRRTKRRRK